MEMALETMDALDSLTDGQWSISTSLKTCGVDQCFRSCQHPPPSSLASSPPLNYAGLLVRLLASRLEPPARLVTASDAVASGNAQLLPSSGYKALMSVRVSASDSPLATDLNQTWHACERAADTSPGELFASRRIGRRHAATSSSRVG